MSYYGPYGRALNHTYVLYYTQGDHPADQVGVFTVPAFQSHDSKRCMHAGVIARHWNLGWKMLYGLLNRRRASKKINGNYMGVEFCEFRHRNALVAYVSVWNRPCKTCFI